MKEYLRIFAKVGIALFCVWHMLAVGLYCIPPDTKDAASTWLRKNGMPYVQKYMMITSQWQQWNLFAPNPLRRIVFYKVEKQNAKGEWAFVTSINDHTYRPWRHAVRFKLLGQALEEKTTRPLLAERALQVLCKELSLEPGANVRIWHDITVVPYIHPSPRKQWWDIWKPHFESTLAIESSCAS